MPGTTKWSGGEHKVTMDAKFLKPVPITRANLETVVKAGWITKENLCRGVDAAKAPGACK